MKLKICGITSLEDALSCAMAGSDRIGFNTIPASPRFVPLHVALSLNKAVKSQSEVETVLLTDNLRITSQTLDFDYFQLYKQNSLQAIAASVMAPLARHNLDPVQAARKGIAMLEGNRHSAPAGELLLEGGAGGRGGTGTNESIGKLVETALLVKKAVPAAKIWAAGGMNTQTVLGLGEACSGFGLSVSDIFYGIDCCTYAEILPGRKDAGKVREMASACRKTTVVTGNRISLEAMALI